jgi:2-methylisocitrate lyase-like PEP mutase family enzyme
VKEEPIDLDELIEMLKDIRTIHGNMPVFIDTENGFRELRSVHTWVPHMPAQFVALNDE